MEEQKEEMSEKEKRIRSLTQLYYSQPKIQEALLVFAQGREVVPRYFEGFGRRPDILQYPSDIMGLVQKGATSFHASEERWRDPLALNSDMSAEEMTALRSSWDVLIDIDSQFLDCSHIAAQLILDVLEAYGVKSYNLKFSGSKGFHILVPGEAFPDEHDGAERRIAFPEWPRAICKYLMHAIRKKYNETVTPLMPSVEVLEQRTNKKKEELLKALCPICGRPSSKGSVTEYLCDDCGFSMRRKDVKPTKRELKCVNCPGTLRIEKSEEYFFCEHCKATSFDKLESAHDSAGKVTYTKEARQSVADFSDEFSEQVSGEALGGLDLVLVAPRHLFRMPYALHEKTTLASVVLTKAMLATFTPRDANPLKVVPVPYLLHPTYGEATRLLAAALAWKKVEDAREAHDGMKRYTGKPFEAGDLKGVRDEMFPPAIQKLLKGLHDGKKRGLFVLITFLRACGFSPEDVSARVHAWNTKNQPSLKEGYLRTQLDWHFRQKRKILPPNYENDAFYKDLGLFQKQPAVKNPLVEVRRALRAFVPQNKQQQNSL